eukprot:6114460-Pleurochrysis_carterae.AAC.1
MRKGRKRRLHTLHGVGLRIVRYCGLVANEELAMKCVEVLFEELAASIGEPGDSAYRKIALIVGEEGLKAGLHLCSTRIAQIVHLQILCCC